MKQEEKEIKVKLSKESFNKIEKRVSSFASFKGQKIQKDEYFDTDKFFVTNLNRGLRIRWDDDKPKLVEFKSLFLKKSSNEKDPWYIEEIKMPLPLSEKSVFKLKKVISRLGFGDVKRTGNRVYNYNNVSKLFNGIGLQRMVIVDKIRREYTTKDAVYVFDTIEGLGYFIEVEANNPIQILKNIGVKNIKVNRIGYNDMLAKGRPNYLSNEEKQKLFVIDPGWNVLPVEEKYVYKLLQ
jgi:adenylate cyclase class IV